MLILSFSKTKEIGKKVARILKAQYTAVTVEQFPDKELKINLNKNPKKQNIIIIQSFTDPNKTIIETLLTAYTVKKFGCKKLILVATYLPYLRQDQTFKKYEAVSAKIIMKILSNTFNKIYIVDPHLHRIKKIKKLSKKARRITSNQAIASYIKKNFRLADTLIVGPDKESFQWAESIAKNINLEANILKKQRFSSRKVKVSQNIKGKFKRIIIIDDIISTGKTMLETIKLAKKHTKNVICIGIHGIFSEDADKELRKHAELITTNSIKTKYSKIDISNEIAKHLK